MKNITLSADENLIEAARQRALSERTTLNEQFRRWLADYVIRRSGVVGGQPAADADPEVPAWGTVALLAQPRMNSRNCQMLCCARPSLERGDGALHGAPKPSVRPGGS